jgi:hypothetical protein
MKTLAVGLGLCAVLFSAARVGANELEVDLERERRGPATRLGFQMALRTGFALPVGKASGEDGAAMSDVTTGHVPLIVELGGKVVPNLFLGGYVGLSAGRAAGATDDLCDGGDYDCYVTAIRAGFEGHFQIHPHGSANPWIGYGIGYESLQLKLSGGDEDGSLVRTGPEYARIMGGLDFRLSRVFGFGPFLDVAIGKYTRYEDDLPGEDKDAGSIPRTATHEWVTFGARFVFFP